MNDKMPKSEGEQLDAVLDELQREHTIKEISGWDTGFANLNRALDGLLPGLHLLIGPPGCGKTSFAKQLLDQVAMRNSVPAIFFSFAERQKELRIKTLSRLSGIEGRELRRGSAYLLHWYGVPRLGGNPPSQLPASWEKLRGVAEEARSWLERVYLIECDRDTTLQKVEAHIDAAQSAKASAQSFIVIDDCQRVGHQDQSLASRLPIVAEALQQLAITKNLPVLAVWPELSQSRRDPPQLWAELVPSANTILVMANQPTLPGEPTGGRHLLDLHIVRNRGGERGKIVFEFVPPFSKFVEADAAV
jgi:replicative DNA helicase